MSFEDELGRQLHAKATNVRVAPNPADLASRIRSAERRVARHERLALGAAVVVLAASLGGLAGAFASTPQAKPSNSESTRYTAGGTGPTTPGPPTTTPTGGNKPPGHATPARRTAIDVQLAGGVSLTATVQPFGSPVAVSSEESATAECASGEIVTTTVGQSGSFGGGTSVAELPALGPGGLEILSSGILQASGSSQEWWVTTAVGSQVTTVAAENVGGVPVMSAPSDGIDVLAGPVPESSVSDGEMSAVAESAAGDESLAFSLGSGPEAVGTAAGVTELPGCSPLRLPSQPSSAAASQPAEPSLAAASVIASFEQADSANPLLGFAANLAAVSDGGRLSSPAETSKRSVAKPGSEAAASDGGVVDVQQVTFLSASTADVVYHVENGVLFTGEAQLGPSGIWRMSFATFCSSLRAGIVEGDPPSGVVSAC
jgi:hypothetical protein